MKIMFLGDVMGRSGRDAITAYLPRIKAAWDLDFVIVNGENATSGHGLNANQAKELLAAGADVITLGDHAFDQRDMMAFIDTEPRIIRPLNFARTAPGKGFGIYPVRGGRKILVMQALGQIFMKRPFSDPFSAIEPILRANPIGSAVNAALLDIHCEATSEKMGVGHFCDGRVSCVVGTHTHVPTGDAQIMARGTAFQADAGMCGDYNSVIGMEKAEPLRRFVTGMPKGRFMPAKGPATLSGLYVETDDVTGLARDVVMVRQGGRLARSGPLPLDPPIPGAS